MLRRLRRHSERGVAMVEAGIAMPIIFGLIFLVFQSSLFGRAYLATGEAAANAARTAAVSNRDPLADYTALTAAASSLTSVPKGDVLKVVTFRATSANNYSVPSGCTTGSVTGWCNYYTGNDLRNLAASNFGAINSTSKDFAWPASTRNADPTDKLGVYVEVKVDAMTSPLPKIIHRTFLGEPEPS